MSNSLWAHGLQHTRLLYSPLSPRVCSTSYPLSWWCYLPISSSSAPLLLLPSIFPSIRAFSNESTLCMVLKYFIKDVLYHMLNYYSIMLLLFGYWKHTIIVLFFFLKYWTSDKRHIFFSVTICQVLHGTCLYGRKGGREVGKKNAS